MKSPSSRALALVCLATLAATGCASDRVTGPDADVAAPAAAGDEFGSTAVRGVDKVMICHIPPGNPENQHTITVGAPAVPAHLANHGDYVGKCQIGK